MRNTKLVIVVATAALLLGGCAREHLRSDFGKSNRINGKAQVVDANAVNREAPLAAMDGKKAEAAVDRYRKEKPESNRGKLVSEIAN